MDINALKQISFPWKIWHLLQKPILNGDLISWGRNGSTIIMNIDNIEDYLLGPRSIFKTKNIYSFLRQLNLYGFVKIHTSPLKSLIKAEQLDLTVPYIHEYRNAYFRRNRPQLLRQIQRNASDHKQHGSYKVLEKSRLCKKSRQIQNHCYGKSSNLRKPSDLQKARYNLSTILQLKHLQRKIDQKLYECEQLNHNVIELSNDIFEIATESCSNFEESSIAGFYGTHSSNELLRNFFGIELLPTYASNNENKENDETLVNIDSSTLDSYPMEIEQTTKNSHFTAIHYATALREQNRDETLNAEYILGTVDEQTPKEVDLNLDEFLSFSKSTVVADEDVNESTDLFLENDNCDNSNENSVKFERNNSSQQLGSDDVFSQIRESIDLLLN